MRWPRQLPGGGAMPQGGTLMQPGPGFLGQPFMTSPGHLQGNMPGMQQNSLPPSGPGGPGPMSGGPMSGGGVPPLMPQMPGTNLPNNLGMQLAGPQGPLLGNFNQLQQGPGSREPPESRGGPGNINMPNLGMMPMWPDQQRGEAPRPMGQGPNMGQPCGNLGEGNQINQQMTMLTGGLPPPSGQVMGAFCAQLLGGSMPAQMGGDQLHRAPDKGPEPGGSMDALRQQPWMLQELAANAMMRDLDGGPNNLSQAGPGGLRPMTEQMPNNQSSGGLLTLQQQQLILQQLQTSQPGSFCGMGDLPGPNQAPPAPNSSGGAQTTMPQFQNQQLRMQGGAMLTGRSLFITGFCNSGITRNTSQIPGR